MTSPCLTLFMFVKILLIKLAEWDVTRVGLNIRGWWLKEYIIFRKSSVCWCVSHLNRSILKSDQIADFLFSCEIKERYASSLLLNESKSTFGGLYIAVISIFFVSLFIISIVMDSHLSWFNCKSTRSLNLIPFKTVESSSCLELEG